MPPTSYEIYVYGSGDFVVEIFKGLVLINSSDMISQLVALVLLVGLIVAIIQPITNWLSAGHLPMHTGGEGFIALFRQVILVAVITRLLLIPVANVLIVDRLDPGQGGPVNNVPLVQAVLAHGASKVGDTVGKYMEQAFNQPSVLNFRAGGVGLGIKYIDSIFSIRPPSSSTPTGGASTNAALISQSLRDYFSQCVFPNYGVLDGGGGSKTAALYRLSNQNDILGALATDAAIYADPNIYITSPNSTGTASCAEALSEINTAWGNVKSDWLKEVEAKVAGDSSIDPATIGTGSLGQEVIRHYFPLASDPYKVLQNIAVGNLMRDAALLYGAKYGDTTETAANLATKSTMSGWVTTARVFGSIVHVMRNLFEGLIYGLSCLLPIAVAVGGLAPLGTYLRILLWLQLWVPFYVLLNLFGDMEMQRAMNQLVAGSADGGPTVKQWLEVGEKAQLSLAYIGSLSFVVPSFAWGLLKGGEYAMSTAVNAMSSGSGAAQTASSIGGSVGIGNTHAFSKNIGNDRVGVSTYAISAMHFADSMGDFRAKTDVKGLTGFNFSEQAYSRSVISGLNSAATLDAYPDLNTALRNKSAAAKFDYGKESSIYHASVMNKTPDGKAADPVNMGLAAALPQVEAGYRGANELGVGPQGSFERAATGAHLMGEAQAWKLVDNVTWFRSRLNYAQANGIPLIEALQMGNSRFNQGGDDVATDMNGNVILRHHLFGKGTTQFDGFTHIVGDYNSNRDHQETARTTLDNGTYLNDGFHDETGKFLKVGDSVQRAAQTASGDLFGKSVDLERFWFSADENYRAEIVNQLTAGVQSMYTRSAVGSTASNVGIGGKGGFNGEHASVMAMGDVTSRAMNVRESNEIRATISDAVQQIRVSPNYTNVGTMTNKLMDVLKDMHTNNRTSANSSLPGRHVDNVKDLYQR